MSINDLLKQIEDDKQQALHRADDVEREAIYATRKLTYGDVALLPDHVVKSIMPEERLQSLQQEAAKFTQLTKVDKTHQQLHHSIQDIVAANKRIAEKLKEQEVTSIEEQPVQAVSEIDDDLLADETDYSSRRLRHKSNYRAQDKSMALVVGLITIVAVLATLAIWHFIF